MSEYQYYEFQAVDHSLTEKEMSELRSFSTRASISPHRFTNEYSWGSFKGNEDLWMEKYFDGFLYYANWGTHILKLRLPSALLDFETAQLYSHDDYLSVRQSEDKLILDFLSENEDYEEWEEDLQLSLFLPLRVELSKRDLRCLYLGWLSGIKSDEHDEPQVEPPIPPGLQELSPALSCLTSFLRIDQDLVQAAANTSPSLKDSTPNPNHLQAWLSTLSLNEKEAMLANILEGSINGDHTAATLQANRFTQMWQSLQKCNKETPKRRTVGQLLKEAELTRQKRLQVEAEKKAAALEEQKRLQQMAREKRLNEIRGHESNLWNEIEFLASEKRAKSYERAIELLTDLRDLSIRENSTDFSSRLGLLKQRHSAKSSFIKKLNHTFDT